MYPAIHLNCAYWTSGRTGVFSLFIYFLWITKTPGLHCNKTQYFGFVDRVSPAYIIQGVWFSLSCEISSTHRTVSCTTKQQSPLRVYRFSSIKQQCLVCTIAFHITFPQWWPGLLRPTRSCLFQPLLGLPNLFTDLLSGTSCWTEKREKSCET